METPVGGWETQEGQCCMNSFSLAQWKESFSKLCGLSLLLVFWLKWAGYLAVAGLNLLAQISDRISPDGV